MRGAHSRELPVRTFGIRVTWYTETEALEAWRRHVIDQGWSPVGRPHVVEGETEREPWWHIDLTDTAFKPLWLREVFAVGIVEGRVVQHPDLTILDERTVGEVVAVVEWDEL